jgi:hypothetical protein
MRSGSPEPIVHLLQYRNAFDAVPFDANSGRFAQPASGS